MIQQEQGRLSTVMLTDANLEPAVKAAVGMTDKVFKGTTTCALTFDKGVIVAADKRATMGHFIAAKTVEKVHLIDDKIAMTMAGGVGDAQILARLVKAEIEIFKYTRGKAMSVKAVGTLLSNVLQGNKYFPYMVQLIVAGFDDKPTIFDLDPFGGLLEEKYVSTGSGSVTAYGILDEYYVEGMTRDDAARIAVRAINSAMRRDSATGEGIDVFVITKEGSVRLTKAEVQSYIDGQTIAATRKTK